MKNKLFLTGSVFQFYVPEISKYAFCKFFDFKYISGFHGLLAQVFDKFEDADTNSLSDLTHSDWLFGPRSMHKWPNLKKDSGWKLLGVLNSVEDEKIPDFKQSQSFDSIVKDEATIGPWYPVHNLTERGQICDYKNIRHLEQMTLTTSSLGIVWRTGMEYCRSNGLKPEEYYDLDNEGIRNMYFQMINVPEYKDIPKNIRGKAILKNQ